MTIVSHTIAAMLHGQPSSVVFPTTSALLKSKKLRQKPPPGGVEHRWSDEICLGLLNNQTFPNPNHSQVLNAYKEFLTWICYPRVPVLKVSDLIIRVALLAETGDETPQAIFRNFMSEGGNIDLDWSSLIPPGMIAGSGPYPTPRDTHGTAMVMGSADPVTGLRMPRSWEEAWDTGATETGPLLRRALSFMAMILTRAVVKTSSSIIAYWNGTMIKNIEGFYALSFTWECPELREYIVDVIINKMHKGSRLVTKFHTAAIITYAQEQGADAQATQASGILMAACLLALSGNGLTLVCLYYDCLEHVGMDPNKFLETCLSGKTQASIELLYKFLTEVAEPGEDESSHTWAFCRYLNDKVWSDLALNYHKTLGSMFAAIKYVVDMDANDGIWELRGLDGTPMATKELATSFACGIIGERDDAAGPLTAEMSAYIEKGRERAREVISHMKRARDATEEDEVEDDAEDNQSLVGMAHLGAAPTVGPRQSRLVSARAGLRAQRGTISGFTGTQPPSSQPPSLGIARGAIPRRSPRDPGATAGGPSTGFSPDSVDSVPPVLPAGMDLEAPPGMKLTEGLLKEVQQVLGPSTRPPMFTQPQAPTDQEPDDDQDDDTYGHLGP